MTSILVLIALWLSLMTLSSAQTVKDVQRAAAKEKKLDYGTRRVIQLPNNQWGFQSWEKSA